MSYAKGYVNDSLCRVDRGGMQVDLSNHINSINEEGQFQMKNVNGILAKAITYTRFVTTVLTMCT